MADSFTGGNHLYKPTCIHVRISVITHTPVSTPHDAGRIIHAYTVSLRSLHVYSVYMTTKVARGASARFFRVDWRVKKRRSGVWTVGAKWPFWPPFYGASIRGMVEGNNLHMDSTRAEARGLLATMTRILSSIKLYPKVQTIDHTR